MRLILSLVALIGIGLSAHYERDCPCSPEKLWLDIVVGIDTSIGMTEEGVTQVLADLSTVFGETKIAQGEGHHTRMGVVTYGEKAQTRYNLTDFKSTEEMMNGIWEIKCSDDKYSNLREGLTRTQEIMKHGRQGGVRANVKSAIIIYASDFREGDVNDAVQLADQIKIGGTEIVVVAFDQGGKLNVLEGLKKIASPGRLFKSTAKNLVGLIQDALCQTNCFCKKLWTQYADGTVKYGECLRIGGIDANWVSAKRACQSIIPGGHLATELDSYKHDFIARMFKDDYRHEPPYMYHIGLSFDKLKKDYFWEQPKGRAPLPLNGSPFRYWSRGYPNVREKDTCVLAAQTTIQSSEIGWQNEHCTKVAKRYICQVESCDTDNYCANL
ncbi:hypothetical protein Aduo_006499 [Ancylostoma duodenale]